MRYHIAHSVRGRLRLRVPSPWLRTRQGAVESRLRALTGVRAVAGNTLTGSLRIDYDPFRLAEQSLVDELKHLDAHLTGPPPARRRRPRWPPASYSPSGCRHCCARVPRSVGAV